MTDIDVYQPPAQPEQYQARMAMTPEAAKALDEQVRLCTRAVLRDGVDYGTIPGAGDRKLLLKPGAEKLLQWFGFGYTCDRTEIDVDDDGVKQGVTYRCTVTRQLPEGRIAAVTTCEGYAGYDELKFYKPVTDAERHRAESRERGWAAKDRRPADPTKWQNLQPYKAPWNTIIKMAQKRAIVGAAIVATAASGLFSTEEDQSPVADDGSTWYEQALEAAFTFTTKEAGDEIYVGAFDAYRNGLCNGKQKDHVQNKVRQRQDRLKTAGKPVDAEELGRQAAASASDAVRTPQPEDADHDTPGTATTPQIGAIWTVLSTVFKFGKDEKDQARAVCSRITRHALESTKDMSRNEAKAVLDTLASWRQTAEENGEQPREFLIELMTTAENGGSSE